MNNVTTDIIPTEAQIIKVEAPHKLDLRAICVFTAIGFFLDDNTYWKDEKVLRPASKYTFDASSKLIKSEPWFKWHHTPKAITFNETLEEFSTLFEDIIQEQVQDKKVILPLSGGLDSRTQAAALKAVNSEVFSYSYSFNNGYDESKIAKQIARLSGFEFEAYTIEEGYLWDKLDRLAQLNQCFTDFTTPRQMAIYNAYGSMGDVFSLGHWGDVLFDSMRLPQLSETEQVDVLLKKLLKRGGLEIATQLWMAWGLSGSFKDYLRDRITQLLRKIDIDNTNARLRAFKSMYWAPRWTSVNLSIFSAHKPITLPYYDYRMCQFICTIPEDYLSDRKLQLAYIKKRAPELAKITWQDHRPYNLYNYNLNKIPYNLPYKVKNKLYRLFQAVSGKPYVQRNWELQFLGKENDLQLKKQLFDSGLENMIAKDILVDYYKLFKEKDRLQFAHAINMLLVLAKFNQNHYNG